MGYGWSGLNESLQAYSSIFEEGFNIISHWCLEKKQSYYKKSKSVAVNVHACAGNN